MNNNNEFFNSIYEEYLNSADVSANKEEMIPGKERIIAVQKNDDGDIIAFKTESGRELDYLTALDEAKGGKLAHIDVFHKYGRDIIRSEPDGTKENNLDQMPEF